MHLGDWLTGCLCLGFAIVLLVFGSAGWLAIRGRPITPDNIGRMIGGIVQWMIADFLINMVLSSIFDRRRRW